MRPLAGPTRPRGRAMPLRTVGETSRDPLPRLGNRVCRAARSTASSGTILLLACRPNRSTGSAARHGRRRAADLRRTRLCRPCRRQAGRPLVLLVRGGSQRAWRPSAKHGRDAAPHARPRHSARANGTAERRIKAADQLADAGAPARADLLPFEPDLIRANFAGRTPGSRPLGLLAAGTARAEVDKGAILARPQGQGEQHRPHNLGNARPGPRRRGQDRRTRHRLHARRRPRRRRSGHVS